LLIPELALGAPSAPSQTRNYFLKENRSLMKMLKMLRIIGVLASAGAATNASETSHCLRVNVPFAFVVAGQQFSPGEYKVTETETGVITVQGQGKSAALIGMPLEGEGRQHLGTPFHQ
jgi:hypothetical protein